MTRLAATNAETGIYSAEGWSRLTTGNEVVRDNTVTPYEGSWSWCLGGDGVAKNSWRAIAPTVGQWYIFRGRIRISAAPATIQTFPGFTGSGSTATIQPRLNTTGTLMQPSTNSVADARESAALTAGAWATYEGAYRAVGPSGLLHSAIFRFGGAEFCRYQQRIASGTFSRYCYTQAAAAFPVRVNWDDIVLNDDLGSADNYWADSTRPLSRSALGYSAPTVRSTATVAATGTTTASAVVNCPPTVAAGDLLVAAIAWGSRGDTITPPSGWTLIASATAGAGVALHIFRKTATGSEPSTYTFTASGSRTYRTVAWALAGVDTSSPVVDSLVAFREASSAAQVAPPLDLTEGDTCVLQLLAYDFTAGSPMNVTTNFTGATDGLVNSQDSAVNLLGLAGGFKARTDGGLLGGDVVTLSSGSPAQGQLAQVAFRAATPAPPSSSANRLLMVA